MSECALSRRAVLAAIGALAASQRAAVRSALARTGPVGGVRVDVSPLLQPTAGWVAETLPPATAQALAAAGRSGAVSLRINTVYLGPNRGSECGPAKDEMVGVVTVGGVERPLRANSSYFPSPADNAMIEQSNFDRIYQLSQAFAYWVARGF